MSWFPPDAPFRAPFHSREPQAGRNYSVVGLGRLIGTASSNGRSLNEPAADGSGGLTLEVVGVSSAQSGAQKAALWTVQLP